jgi:hypothetical protein
MTEVDFSTLPADVFAIVVAYATELSLAQFLRLLGECIRPARPGWIRRVFDWFGDGLAPEPGKRPVTFRQALRKDGGWLVLQICAGPPELEPALGALLEQVGASGTGQCEICHQVRCLRDLCGGCGAEIPGFVCGGCRASAPRACGCGAEVPGCGCPIMASRACWRCGCPVCAQCAIACQDCEICERVACLSCARPSDCCSACSRLICEGCAAPAPMAGPSAVCKPCNLIASQACKTGHKSDRLVST